MKQPEEISQEFIQKILSRLEELDGAQQDIFFNSFLDNLEMEVEDKAVYDEGRNMPKMLCPNARLLTRKAIGRNFLQICLRV